MPRRKKQLNLTDVDDALIEKLCNRIERGHPKVATLKSLGINYASFSTWLKKGESGTDPTAVKLYNAYKIAVQKSIKVLETAIEERPTKKIVNKDENGVVTGITEIWDVRSLNLVRSFRPVSYTHLTLPTICSV